MKKIFAGMMISSVIFLSFYHRGPENRSLSPTQQVRDSCTLFCSNYKDSGLQGMITRDVLVRMSRDYFNDVCKSYISPSNVVNNDYNTARRTQQRDALSMVFDLKKLKTLIWQMERYSCQHHCNPKVAVGIRFYYVKYLPTTGTPQAPLCLRGISSNEKNKHALVMVPAFWNEKTKAWYDYNIWGKKFVKCFMPFQSLDSLVGVGGFFTLDGDPDSGDNHGGVGPPPDPGTFGN